MKKTLSIIYFAGLFNLSLKGQDEAAKASPVKPMAATDTVVYQKQHDLIDISLLILHGKYNSRSEEPTITDTKAYITAAPVIEYTLATGFSLGAIGNIAFKRSIEIPTKTSFLLAELKYSQKKQILLPVQSSYWSKGNGYNLSGDWRFFDYVQDSYGLGGDTKAAAKYLLTYKYIRFSELVLKKIRKDIYGGAGYQLDYHWQIKENGVQQGTITDFQKYGFASSSASSGLTAVILYDSRDNAINSTGDAAYAKLQYIQNSRWLEALLPTMRWSLILENILPSKKRMCGRFGCIRH